MLDLEARVHLQEVERSIGGEQELASACVGVADHLRGGDRGGAHAGSELLRNHRRRRLFDDLLVPALERALALTERDHLAVPVAEDLDFDVTRPLDELLEKDRVIAERRQRFGARQTVGLFELVRSADDAHPLAAAAGRGFEDHRIADPPGGFARRREIRERAVRARHHRHSGGDHPLARRGLRAHRRDRLRRRTDERDAALAAERRELGALGKEAVARMDRVGADLDREIDECGGLEVALGSRRRADAVSLVRREHGERLAIGVGVGDRAADPFLAQRAQNPHGDLAAIRDENFAKALQAGSWIKSGGIVPPAPRARSRRMTSPRTAAANE